MKPVSFKLIPPAFTIVEEYLASEEIKTAFFRALHDFARETKESVPRYTREELRFCVRHKFDPMSMYRGVVSLEEVQKMTVPAKIITNLCKLVDIFRK